MYYTNHPTPVGMTTLASDGESLVGLWIEGQKYFGGTVEKEMSQNNDLRVFADTKDWLDRYFAGEKPSISNLPLAPTGGDFRKLVWGLLCNVPYGECITYGEIAKKVAKKLSRDSMSGQAVGGAIAHNPIIIIIPCHRVIGTNGSLTGYAGGIDKKVMLLKHENADISRLRIPTKGTAL